MTPLRVMIFAAVFVCGCGLVGDVDEGQPSVSTRAELQLANEDLIEIPQFGIWAYHDVEPKRWGRHTDLTLNITFSDERGLRMLVNLPTGFDDERTTPLQWSITPTAFAPWFRVSNDDDSQVFIGDAGALTTKVSFKEDGEFVSVTGADLVLSDECGNELRVDRFSGVFRVGEDDLLNKFSAQDLENVATIAEGSGDGATLRIEGVKQSEGSIEVFFERSSGRNYMSYLATFLDICGTKLGGIFADLPLDTSATRVRSSTRVVVVYDNPSAPDGVDFWATDTPVEYGVDHWPNGVGDYAKFDLVGPVTLYRLDFSSGSLEIDRSASKTLDAFMLTADLDRDCRPGRCN